MNLAKYKNLQLAVDHISLHDMNQKLVELRRNAYNPDSNFTVSAALIYRTAAGEIKMTTGINTEMSYDDESNFCAERSALTQARQDGNDIEILATFVTGDKRDNSLDKANPKNVSCCHVCLDQLMQFADFEQSLIISIPANDGSSEEEAIALDNLDVKTIGRLIPPILRYDVSLAYEAQRKPDFSAMGLYEDAEEIINPGEQTLDMLAQDFKTKFGGRNVPLTGNGSSFVRTFADGKEGKQLYPTDYQNMLALMRNHTYFNLIADKKIAKEDIGRLAACIITRGDEHIFAVSYSGNGNIKTPRKAIRLALDNAFSFFESGQSIDSIHIMGEPLMGASEDRSFVDRALPLPPHIYRMLKRSTIETLNTPIGRMELPNMMVHCYKPEIPVDRVESDMRPLHERLTACPQNGEVTSFALHELCMGVSPFISSDRSSGRAPPRP